MVALLLVLMTAGPTTGAPDRPAPEAQPAARQPRQHVPQRDPVADPPAEAAPPPATTSLVSLDTDRHLADASSSSPSVSQNGRWVAFASFATDLVAGDENGAQDVFVRDRSTGSTDRVTLPNGVPVPPKGSAFDPAISADGSTVVFTYRNGSEGDGFCSPVSTIMLWHRATGETEEVSVDTKGQSLPCSTDASVSDDGNLVTWMSPIVLSSEGGPIPQIWLRNVAKPETTLLSATPAGVPGDKDSTAPSISANGAFVAWSTDATNLAPDGEDTDIVMRDLDSGSIESLTAVAGSPTTGPSYAPSVSADGAFVAFESVPIFSSLTLVIGPTQIFVRDRAAQRTILASVAPDGSPRLGSSTAPSIGANGRVVAFAASDLSDFVPPGNDDSIEFNAIGLGPPTEVYARDIVNEETLLISEARGGGPGGPSSGEPSVGGSGRYIAFASISEKLIEGDTNDVGDVFLRELPPVPTISPNPVDFGSSAVGVAGSLKAATVTNTGWTPLAVRGVAPTGAAAGDFKVALNGCGEGLIRRGESCTISILFRPAESGSRTATLTVDHNGPGSPLTTALVGAGSDASVKIEPPIGRPGIVVIATGSGFPSDTDVALSWKPGLSPKMAPVHTGPDGTFRVQVLVFHNDLIGRRHLVAKPVGSASFVEFGTEFLVVEASGVPPRFDAGDPSLANQRNLIFRR